jgi:hypothetical protein
MNPDFFRRWKESEFLLLCHVCFTMSQTKPALFQFSERWRCVCIVNITLWYIVIQYEFTRWVYDTMAIPWGAQSFGLIEGGRVDICRIPGGFCHRQTLVRYRRGFADVTHTRRESGAYVTQMLRAKLAYDVRHVAAYHANVARTCRARSAQQGM